MVEVIIKTDILVKWIEIIETKKHFIRVIKNFLEKYLYIFICIHIFISVDIKYSVDSWTVEAQD